MNIILQYLLLVLLSSFLVLSNAVAQTKIVSPEWSFTDDFEGDLDKGFWLGGVSVDYGYDDPTDSSNKVMKMSYRPNSEGAGDSWSEYDFSIGVNAVQVEMSWRQYIPTNYKHIERNHKVFALWSGKYGVINSNISLMTEAWGSDKYNGALPSLYIGMDGKNFGHTMNANHTPIWEDYEGRWVYIHVYAELAKEEGDYGVFEVYRNGELITGTNSTTLSKSYDSAPDGRNLIEYAERGNYLDQGTLLGWANGADSGGFENVIDFLVDDFKITANSVHGETINLSAPTSPKNVTIDIGN
jgi:hypothetical protein